MNIILSTAEVLTKQDLESEAKRCNARLPTESELLPGHWTIVSLSEEQQEFQSEWDYIFVYRSNKGKIIKRDLYTMAESSDGGSEMIHYQLIKD